MRRKPAMSWDDEDKYAKHERRQVQLKKQKQLKMIMPMVFVVLGILSCGALFLFFHFMTGSEYDDALEDEARNGSKAASMGGNGGLQWPWSRVSAGGGGGKSRLRRRAPMTDEELTAAAMAEADKIARRNERKAMLDKMLADEAVMAAEEQRRKEQRGQAREARKSEKRGLQQRQDAEQVRWEMEQLEAEHHSEQQQHHQHHQHQE